ncbi:MAG: agmatinase [Sulfolobales archaeon]|nr:agmatinase [Sulfolobales archaeon]MCX8185539.1 agmatinase [Sulfolobales archaeon]MDW7969982.1 agmatinase [Sulfolobales archaeon]
MKELYLVRSPYIFNGINAAVNKPQFAIVGVPLDSTSSFRPGCRFAPLYVRLASQSLELFSLRTLVNIEEVPLVDVGDIVIPHGDLTRTLNIIESVLSELIGEGLKVIAIGGEHTSTLGVVKGVIKALGSDLCYVCFDSHSDFRYEYLGSKYSHACVNRRIYELLGGNRISLIGVRAVSYDEYRDLKSLNIKYFTSAQVRTLGFREVGRSVAKLLENCSKTYISIDLDVIDPAYAPGVTTPEPEGITPTELLDILQILIDDRVVGLDVVELTPHYDHSITSSAVAAKVINEAIGLIYTSTQTSSKGKTHTA